MHSGEVGIEIAPLLDAASVDGKLADRIDSLLRRTCTIARALTGAEQAALKLWAGEDPSKARKYFCLSEKYSAYSDFRVDPQGIGLHGMASQPRAEEIELEVLESLDQASAVERLTVSEFARTASIQERIDRHLDEADVVDRKGKPHYLLDKRDALSRQMRFLRGEIKQSEEARSAQKKAVPDLPPPDPDRPRKLAKAFVEIALTNSDPDVIAELEKRGWRPPET